MKQRETEWNRGQRLHGREDGERNLPMQGGSDAYKRGYREGQRKRAKQFKAYCVAKADPYAVVWGDC